MEELLAFLRSRSKRALATFSSEVYKSPEAHERNCDIPLQAPQNASLSRADIYSHTTEIKVSLKNVGLTQVKPCFSHSEHWKPGQNYN